MIAQRIVYGPRIVKPLKWQQPNIRCPKCGAMVAVDVRYGKRFVGYHHPAGAGFFEWCSGSDYPLDEEVEATE